MCTSNKTSDFGLHSCLIKSKQAINKREFYRGASVGHVGLKQKERRGKERISKTSETTVHDITIMSTMWCYLNVIVGTGWLRVGLVSQLVMRSFDVADKGEVNKAEGPLGKRAERTLDHNHRQKKKKTRKREKRWEKCGWRQQAAPGEDRKASS